MVRVSVLPGIYTQTKTITMVNILIIYIDHRNGAMKSSEAQIMSYEMIVLSGKDNNMLLVSFSDTML